MPPGSPRPAPIRSWGGRGSSARRAGSRLACANCGRRWAQTSGLGRSGDRELARGADAASAGVDALGVPADEDRRLLDVGDPAARGLAVGVAHIVAEGNALATDFAAILQAFSLVVGS